MRNGDRVLTLVLILLATVPLMLAQNLQPSPQLGPLPPSQTLGPQLIAWSVLQQPQPIQQASPSVREQPYHAAETQQDNTQSLQQTTLQYFTGTIEKDDGRYVLKVSRYSTFELDNQQTAKQYVGLQVRITATVYPDGVNLHIIGVKPLS